MQHGGHHEDSVLRGLLPVLRAGRHALVRIPVGRFDMASRALDFGAEAVIAPMINSVEDARRFAAAMKYPPLGERSWGPTYAFPRHGKGDFAAWLGESNAAHHGLRDDRDARRRSMRSTASSKRPASTAIFLGPSDFSIAWSNGKTINADARGHDGDGDVGRRTRPQGRQARGHLPYRPARLPAASGRMGYQLFAMRLRASADRARRRGRARRRESCRSSSK